MKKSTKINKKLPKIDENRPKSALGAILEGYGGHLGPKMAPRANKSPKSYFLPPPKGLQVGGQNPPNWEVWGHVGAIWAPCWPPKGYQDDINFFNHFGIDFLIILNGFWEDFRSQNLWFWASKSISRGFARAKQQKRKIGLKRRSVALF